MGLFAGVFFVASGVVRGAAGMGLVHFGGEGLVHGRRMRKAGMGWARLG
jgi:hypothetical protein